VKRYERWALRVGTEHPVRVVVIAVTICVLLGIACFVRAGYLVAHGASVAAAVAGGCTAAAALLLAREHWLWSVGLRHSRIVGAGAVAIALWLAALFVSLNDLGMARAGEPWSVPASLAAAAFAFNGVFLSGQIGMVEGLRFNLRLRDQRARSEAADDGLAGRR
jgi:hypothetical protein